MLVRMFFGIFKALNGTERLVLMFSASVSSGIVKTFLKSSRFLGGLVEGLGALVCLRLCTIREFVSECMRIFRIQLHLCKIYKIRSRL